MAVSLDISTAEKLIAKLIEVQGMYEDASCLLHTNDTRQFMAEIAAQKKLQLSELFRIFLMDEVDFLSSQHAKKEALDAERADLHLTESNQNTINYCIDQEESLAQLYALAIEDCDGPVEVFMLKNHQQDNVGLVRRLRWEVRSVSE